MGIVYYRAGRVKRRCFVRTCRPRFFSPRIKKLVVFGPVVSVGNSRSEFSKRLWGTWAAPRSDRFGRAARNTARRPRSPWARHCPQVSDTCLVDGNRGRGALGFLGGIRLFDSYHCSRYNTNTGVLTAQMFEAVFAAVRAYLG